MSRKWIQGHPVTGNRSIFTRCRDCGERIVLIEHENESFAPPLEPPTATSHRFVDHKCPARGAGTVRYKVPVDHPQCALHVIRPHAAHGFAAFCTSTGKMLHEDRLDHDCRHALHLLQRGFEPGRGFTSSEAASLVNDMMILAGFTQEVPLAQLRRELTQIPDVPGLYAVLHHRATPYPKFRAFSSAGRFKGRDPSVSIDRLQSEWIPETRILYIGQSERLRNRIDLMLRFGKGERVGKWGGRFIWQMRNPETLVLVWRPLDGNIAAEEKRLLQLFINEHGRLPFANLRLG